MATELGKILTGPQERDAVHIAVAPVIADHQLFPGQAIGFIPGSTERVSWGENPIGIVDPFLKERVMMFLLPNTITSLNHHWSHPAFDNMSTAAPLTKPQSSSRIWIESFAARVGLTYRDLMDGARDWIAYGDYLSRGDLLESEYVPDEFWEHYQAVTGATVKEDKQHSFFTCSC